MKRILLFLIPGLLLPLLSGAQDTTRIATTPPTPPSSHVQFTPAQLKWGDPPPGLPKGARLAVLSGDPGAAGPFTVRLRFPAGYRIAPHWHPTDEHVTVISGTFSVGMGDKYNQGTLKSMPAGSYALLPAEMRHFARARTAVVVQIHGTGPFAINYVDPGDDPRTQTGSQ